MLGFVRSNQRFARRPGLRARGKRRFQEPSCAEPQLSLAPRKLCIKRATSAKVGVEIRSPEASAAGGSQLAAIQREVQ